MIEESVYKLQKALVMIKTTHCIILIKVTTTDDSGLRKISCPLSQPNRNDDDNYDDDDDDDDGGGGGGGDTQVCTYQRQ